MYWQFLAAASCLLSATCLGAAVNGEDVVGVSMCCPEGKVLKLEPPSPFIRDGIFRYSHAEYAAKCVRNRRSPKDTLDGSTITVTGDDDGEKQIVVKKTGIMLPRCPLGLKVQKVALKSSAMEESSGDGPGEMEESKPTSRVRLGDYDCGHGNCLKGNVYVDDKPVCDDGWGDTDAGVVCRELGFEGGYATTESKYGNVDLERQTCFDEVQCSGSESTLLDCRHRSQDDCSDGEGAGVVCYGEEDPAGPEYGDYSSSPSRQEPETEIHLTSSGELTIPTGPLAPTSYKTGEFCMAGVWDGSLGPGWSEVDAIALVCEPCKSEVLCGASLELFSSLVHIPSSSTDFRNSEIVTCEEPWCQTTNSIVLAFDEDRDGKVNFKEFKAKMETYVEKVVNVLDLNAEGSLNEVSIKNLSLKLFLDVLDETFAFSDANQDNILSVEDAPPRTFRDKNDDGKISLREIVGVSPINLPAPLYRLYTNLDKDKNEKLSLEEATNFIKGTFYVIDQNEDCFINLEEIIGTLKESKLTKEFQLAVRLLGDYYFTLADYFLNEFVSAADVDGDKKTTLAEIIGVKDPAVFETMLKAALSMGLPNMRTAEFLVGEGRTIDGRRMSRQETEGVIEMWLLVLYDFVNNKKFDSVPNNLCGFE